MTKPPFALLILGSLALAAGAHEVPAPREVNLAALDGTALKATYFAAAQEGPGVLLMHQCNQQRKKWDELAQKLAAAGIHVLTVDYRGFGESGGTPFLYIPGPERAQTVRQKWPGDMDRAYAYLMSQKGVTQRIAGDSLSVRYVADGQKGPARENAKKALALLPSDTTDDPARRKAIQESAETKLKQLGGNP